MRRRALLDGGIAAVALGGAGLLSGSLTATLGRDDDTATAAATGTPGATSPVPQEQNGGPSVPAAQVPVGGSATVKDPASGDAVYIVQPAAGQYAGLSSVCTHSGCAVNPPKDGQLYCPCHGSKFDAATGAVITGPAVKPLPKYTVTKNGDQLRLGPQQKS
ncbi:ubiquinol-cytochrome c reductase iron-sulfur subunit [Kitasatospora sp. NPDC088391]|uniref:QcrA and Rieske domain-containing protein n=1 Tax=Kitasatospora sp. NPDC088391 TaxID=3364074 RepID=UPI0038124AC5